MQGLACWAGVVFALALLPSAAGAVDWTLGAGVGAAPDYEGSEDYKPIPLGSVKARDLYHPASYVEIRGPRLRSNLVPHENWRLGPTAQYVFKRSDVDNSRVDDLRSTDDGFLMGFLAGYDVKGADGRVLGIEFEPRWDAKGNIGALYTLRLKFASGLKGQSWRFNLGLESTYASDDYMEEFFGISASDSARSGLRRFDADSGIKDAGVSAGATYLITQSWSLTGLFSYKRLLDDAKDSPVTDDEGSPNQFFGGLVLGYRF